MFTSSTYKALVQAHYKGFAANSLKLFGVPLLEFFEEFPRIKLSPFLKAVLDVNHVKAELTKLELEYPVVGYLDSLRKRFDEPA